MGITEKDGEGNSESGVSLDFRELVLSELRQFEERMTERIERLESQQSRSLDRPRNAADTTEQVMMWFGIAYIVSLLLPPLLQLIRGSDE